MKKDTFNIVLTNLSLVNKNTIKEYINCGDEYTIEEKLISLHEYCYYYDNNQNNIEIKGILTNEAGIKYIMHKLKEENDTLDAIFCISSPSAKKKIIYDNNTVADITHIDFFKKRLSLYCEEENIETPLYLLKDNLEIDDNPTSESLINLSARVANEIIELKKKNADKQINLYIESNGGIRDFMLIVVAIIQSINKEIASIKEVIGVNFNISEPKYPICNKTNAYRVYDLYSGIDEFVNYGRSNKIEFYFKDTPLNKEEKNVLRSIDLMSNAFTLCRPIEMLNAIQNLNKAIKQYKPLDNHSDIFNLLVNRINSEYNHIFLCIQKKSIYHFEVLKELIKYCIKHNLLQQALTLYSELIPNILYKEKILYPSNKIINDMSLSDIYDMYYNSREKKMGFSKGYTYVQRYIFIKNNKQTLDQMGLIDIYNNFSGNQIVSTDTQKSTLEKLLQDNYVATLFDYENVIRILINYSSIKTERNKSNHANTDSINNTNKELKRIIKLIESGLTDLSSLILEKHQ